MSHKLFVGLGALLATILVALGLHAYSANVEANLVAVGPTEPLIRAGSALKLEQAPAVVQPTATAKPRPSPTATRPAPTPTAVPTLPAPATLNGVPLDKILVMASPVKQHIREIYARGQQLGRDPHAFSKVGDSTMVWPPFTALFDDPTAYVLGPQFQYLQPTIDQYRGSFVHISAAAKKSMHSWGEFDPDWANNPRCHDGEAPMECELRINNPSIVLIRLGANDTYAPAEFEKQMRRIIDFWSSNGVIPVLGTKPDRLEGPDNTLNKIVARLANSYQIPLWDYDLIAGTVPGKGLVYDHVHFQAYGSHDYSSRDAFAAADSLEDLTGLMMVDAITREVRGPGAGR